MPNPPGLSRGVGLRRFLKGVRNAGEFDALYGRNGYALFLKLGLNAAAQFSSHFILARWGGPHLQPYRGSSAIKILEPKDPRPTDKGLCPCWIGAQCGVCPLPRLHTLIERT